MLVTALLRRISFNGENLRFGVRYSSFSLTLNSHPLFLLSKERLSFLLPHWLLHLFRDQIVNCMCLKKVQTTAECKRFFCYYKVLQNLSHFFTEVLILEVSISVPPPSAIEVHHAIRICPLFANFPFLFPSGCRS